jgi:hypothetical protein
MIGIIAMIALFIGSFSFAIFIDESFNKAFIYAALLTISVSGLFTMSNFILPLPLSIMGLVLFVVMLLRGNDFLESLFAATMVSRIILICIGLCSIVLPATVVWLIINFISNWVLVLIVATPITAVFVWYISLEYWPMIKVHLKHTFSL